MKTRALRLKLYWLLCGDWWWDRLEDKIAEPKLERINSITEWLQKPLCALLGHIPQADACGVPAHDFCLCCRCSMPGAVPRRHRNNP